MFITPFVLALIAAAPLAEPAAGLSQTPDQPTGLAAQSLTAGRAQQALDVLQKASAADPHDAAVLINLGIAYAQMGEDAKARAAFEQALACHEVVELDTADGTATDSRRLARKAIKMLDRGEFRSNSQQLTYRD